MKVRAGGIVYLLPVALLVGTNVKVYESANRPVYFGASEIAILLGLISLLAVVSQGARKVFIPSSILIWILAFSATVLLSNPVAVLIGRWTDWPLGSILEVVRWFEYASVLLIVAVLVNRRSQLAALLVVSLFCLVASEVAALYQAATFDFYQQRTYGLVRSASDVAGLSKSNPNTAGAIFMIGSILLLSFLLHEKRFRRRLLLSAPFVASFASMLFTWSRSSTVGFVVGAIAVVLMMPGGLRRRLSGAAIVVAVTALGAYLVWRVPSLSERVLATNLQAGAVLDRLEHWQVTSAHWQEFLAFGVGWGRFGDFFGFVTPDNLYLELYASLGTLGVVTFLGMMRSLGSVAVRIRAGTDSLLGGFRAGYVGVVVAAMVVSISGSTVVFAPRVIGLFWLLSGLAVKIGEWQRNAGDPGSVPKFV